MKQEFNHKNLLKKLTNGSFDDSTTRKFGHNLVSLGQQLAQLVAVVLGVPVPHVDRPVLTTHRAPRDLLDTHVADQVALAE